MPAQTAMITLQAVEGNISVSCTVSGIDVTRVKRIDEKGLTLFVTAASGVKARRSLPAGLVLRILLHRGPYQEPIILEGRVTRVEEAPGGETDDDELFEIEISFKSPEKKHRGVLRQAVLRFAIIRLRQTRQTLARLTGEHLNFDEERGIGRPDRIAEENRETVTAPDDAKSTESNSFPPMMMPKALRRLLGDILVEKGALSSTDLNEFLQRRRDNGRRIGEQLVDAGLVSSRAVSEALAIQAGLTFINLNFVDLDKLGGWKFHMSDMAEYRFIPVYAGEKFVKIAVASPLDGDTLFRLREKVGVPIKQEIAEESLVLDAVEYFSRRLGPDDKPIQSHKSTVELSLKRITVRVQYELFDEKGRPLTKDVMRGLLKQVGRDSIHFIGPVILHEPVEDILEITDMLGLEVFLPDHPEPLIMVTRPLQITRLPEEIDPPVYLFEVILVDIDKFTAIRLNRFRESL